jgi:hypothetical protein
MIHYAAGSLIGSLGRNKATAESLSHKPRVDLYYGVPKIDGSQ